MNRTLGKRKEVYLKRGMKKKILSTNVFVLGKSSQVRGRRVRARKKW